MLCKLKETLMLIFMDTFQVFTRNMQPLSLFLKNIVLYCWIQSQEQA